MGRQATGIDVDAARDATPGCHDQAFLLSAGASLPTTRTLDAVVSHLRREAEIGGYAAADEATDTISSARANLGELVGARPNEVALAASDTAAWIKVWWGWFAGGNVPRGGTVLVDRFAYLSHFAAIAETARLGGFEVRVLPSLPDGTIDLAATTIDPGTSVVAATMVPTHCGNVNPVADLGSLCRSAGVPLFVDACQAVGQLHLDVTELGCDVLTGTGRKFLRAPRGTGFAWIRAELAERFRPPGIDGTNTDWDARTGLHINAGVARFEEFEVAVAAQVGLAEATRQALDIGVPAIERRVTGLADALRGELASIAGVTVRDTAARRSAIVTFTVDGFDPTDVVAAADRERVVINASTANWSVLDMHAKRSESVVRASPHYFNTDDDLARLVTVVARHR